MPSELEELVEFLHHGNTQIRQIATENLVQYSKSQPSIFKTAQLTPVKDLKLLIRDYTPIAQHALTILINISNDEEILTALAEDEGFLESVLSSLMNPKEPNADLVCMLLANLSKSESISRLLGLKRASVPALSPSPLAIDQLTQLFNRGANKTYNPQADYDYLAYLFADLAKFPPIATYLSTPSIHDPLSLPPLTLLTPFTTHSSSIRRLGLSSLLYNLCLSLPSSRISSLLSSLISIVPHLLLPLCSPDSAFSESEMDSLLPELQFLGEDHHREADLGILKTLVETIYVIVGKGGKEVRMGMKEMGAYLVVRELHLDIKDEGVRAACEKVVDVLMIDEENGGASGKKNSKEEEETRKMITESSDSKGSQNSTTTESSKLSEETSTLSSAHEQRSLQVVAKSPSDPSSPLSLAPAHNPNVDAAKEKNEANNNNVGVDLDDDDEDDNRIVDIF